jgi:ATP adenylyltransferase
MSERLWAPWRMEYLARGDTDRCVFCELASAQPSTYRQKLVLLVQPRAFVCLNRYPFTGSHLLIVPREHVSNLEDLADEDYTSMMTLVRDAVARVRRATGAEGVNVGLNLGKAAGAGIAKHLHTHVVPRWTGDSNFMPVIADIHVMPEYLDQSWQRLAPSFADLPGEHPLDAPAPEALATGSLVTSTDIRK